MKKNRDNRIPAGELICTVYLCLLGVALPLTVHDAYFDITRTKAVVFWTLSGAFLFAWILWLLFGKKSRNGPVPFAWPDLFFAVFVSCHILSSLIFRPFSSTLTASDNRWQGILSFSMYLGVFLVLRRSGRLSPPVRYALLLGASVAAFLGVLDVFDLSLLPLREVSPAIELPRFLSTVGNISFFGALCLMFLPFAAVYALSAEDLPHALPYALTAALLLCGGMAARTEAFLLGATVFLAAVPLFCRGETMLRRTPLLWTLTALSALLFSLLLDRFALYRPSDLTRLLCAPAVLIPFGLLTAAAYLWLRRKEDRIVLRARKVYLAVLAVLFAVLAVFLLLSNTVWRETLPSSIASFAVFTPSWGSDRGAEWASFWQMFCDAPLIQKLIGNGAGSVADWDRAHRLFSDAVTDSAHNEYLHYLLTGGLVGLTAYLALLTAAMRKALRNPSRARTAAALGCFAYAVQAVVNIAQPFTTPLFFALLALILNNRPAEEEDSAGPFWYVAISALAAALLIVAAA